MKIIALSYRTDCVVDRLRHMLRHIAKLRVIDGAFAYYRGQIELIAVRTDNRRCWRNM